MNLQSKIDRIKNSLESGSYTLAAGESVKIVELSLRQLLGEGLTRFSSGNRLAVMSSILKVGKGERDIEDFGLGSILAVIRATKFFDLWEDSLGCDLPAIRMINFDAMNEVRNKLTHRGYEATKYEAEFFLHAIESIIHAFGLIKLDESDNIAPSESKPSPAKEALAVKETNVKTSSTYSPTEFSELHRLSVQSKICNAIDVKTFRHALSGMKNKSKLVALDIGCANGFLTVDRFDPFDAFVKVIGIDRDEAAIEAAKVRVENNDKYSFHALDIESSNFEVSLKEMLQQEDIEGIDFVFSGLTFHHLRDAVKVLRKVRKIHNSGGAIVIRGSDDGSKLSYPDPKNLVTRILELSSSVQGYSDRQNGRKIHHQLWQSGYRNLNVFFDTKSTVGMTLDERKDFFDMCMSWRANPLMKVLETDVNNLRLQKDIEWVKDALSDLELLFEQEDYFFAQQRISGVGFRQ